MNLRAPTVVRGQALTVELWNSTANAINQGLNGPRDKDAGITASEAGENDDLVPGATSIALTELARTTQSVRVENPSDAEQYVDVARMTSVTLRNTSTGEISTMYFSSS